MFKAYEIVVNDGEEVARFQAQFETYQEAENFIDSFPLDRVLYFQEEN